ncbi:cysteine protease StiP domain-containing protein [Nissabacter sp. SGAir0207]|uniref:cysteine protease StiP domain-containing protein n=1 Tax=Nissabacter sp. SGAir0207 TaxID=2126321 RepID=UPI0010CD3DE2|nr:cysteine protease StiP domain-containing protein [Nissabacter sp. SGAir0207]QCR38528.1 hypothetical protein C1N62_20590 [Nissabacter sp. SGAir0207]
MHTPFALASGSYDASDITFLLSPVEVDYTPVEEKERLIQRGDKHYSEMLSEEPTPSAAHQAIYRQAMAQFGPRIAQEVTALALGLAEQVSARPLVLVSLVRAGVPLGVCLLHTLRDLGIDAVHYGVSIIRDRGLDQTALAHITQTHGSAGVVFVDGWTGKGAISRELAASLAPLPAFGHPPRLAVLADPGGCAWLSASGEDWLMPFGILGAPVSGLVSRSLWREGEFHGAMYCRHLLDHDISRQFVAEIDALRAQLSQPVAAARPDPERRTLRRHLSERVLAMLAETYRVDSLNRIKPGIAEATRAVMRRVPDHVLVSNKADADVALLVHLAEEAGIQVEEVGEAIGIYRAVTIIRKVV